MLAAGALYLFKSLWSILLIFSGISFCGAIVVRIMIWKVEKSDPYSLSKLNEIVNDGIYDEQDIPEVDHNGDKYCLNCHHSYGSQFGVCPRCGR